ncbi:ABC transporter permease subunit [Bradyrhizobium sp. RDT10]
MTSAFLTNYRPLLSATLAVIALPFGLYLLGLSLNTGTMVVALAIAAMGLNLCIGYTGLVSFGHGAWFGIGAYAAGLIQRNWFGGDIFLPLLLAAFVVAIIATFVGFVILRRRGVYFSLLTLALSALAYTIAFRWTAVTGGEDGLGGLETGQHRPVQPRQCAELLHRRLRALPRRALFPAAAGALAVRPCADGDPREPVARHFSRAIRSSATSSACS